MLLRVLLAAASYLIGSFSLSITISKLLPGGDVRRHGSGNAGATNMARVYGMLPGLLTLAGDMLKCVLVMLVGHWLAGDRGMALCGAACLTGHCFPVFYHFKGGKGVSVGAAMGFVVDWRVGVCMAIVFFAFALVSKKVSLGSCAGALMFFAACIWFGMSEPIVIMSAYTMSLVVVKHRENLRRVARGTEPDFKVASKAPKAPPEPGK